MKWNTVIERRLVVGGAGGPVATGEKMAEVTSVEKLAAGPTRERGDVN